MTLLRACGRLCRVLAHVLAGAWTVWRVFPRLSAAQKEERIQAWARELLEVLAIELIVSGPLPQAGPVLLVANHVSWLDIVVVHATGPCRFVSKADVQHWPLVGALAAGAGTLFIERASRRDAMRLVHHMAACLQQGEVLAVFPEGTTGDGTQLLPFHANLLQAAIAAQAPVQPVALHYAEASTGALSLAPCYVGDDSLVHSIWRTARAPGLVAVVTFGAPEAAQGRDRRTWANDLRNRIAALRG